MNQLIVLALVGLFSSASFGSMDLGSLIDSASSEQAAVHQRIQGKVSAPTERKISSKRAESEFTIRLVKLPYKKKTMIAKNWKPLRTR